MKTCTKCGEKKPNFEFRFVGSRLKYRNECTECERKASLDRYYRRMKKNVLSKDVVKEKPAMSLVKTETIVVKSIKDIRTGSLPNGVPVSCVFEDGILELVIGARWSQKSICSFNKRDLKDLIEKLNEVHEVMEDD